MAPPHTVYVLAGSGSRLTDDPALFRSRDDGQSWAELPAIHGVPGMDKWTFPPPPTSGTTPAS